METHYGIAGASQFFTKMPAWVLLSFPCMTHQDLEKFLVVSGMAQMKRLSFLPSSPTFESRHSKKIGENNFEAKCRENLIKTVNKN